MPHMERIAQTDIDGELVVVRLLRLYRGVHDRDGGDRALTKLVALGQNLHLRPATSVALAGVFQLTEAVLGRTLVTECRYSCDYSADERAVIYLFGLPRDAWPVPAPSRFFMACPVHWHGLS